MYIVMIIREDIEDKFNLASCEMKYEACNRKKNTGGVPKQQMDAMVFYWHLRCIVFKHSGYIFLEGKKENSLIENSMITNK